MGERTTEEALRIIRNAENDIIRRETQIESTLKSLKEKYNINSVAEGDSYLDEKGKELDDLEAKSASKKKVLEDSFPWE